MHHLPGKCWREITDYEQSFLPLGESVACVASIFVQMFVRFWYAGRFFAVPGEKLSNVPEKKEKKRERKKRKLLLQRPG